MSVEAPPDEGLPPLLALRSQLGYGGPERRQGGQTAMLRLLACVLDEIDYSVVLLNADGLVMHTNLGAQAELASGASELMLENGHLRCQESACQDKLDQALQAAETRGLRSMLRLGVAKTTSVSIVPLPLPLTRAGRGHAVLVTLQRNRIVGSLSVGAYSRSHGLTPREEQVLSLLCDGKQVAEIAQRLQVSLATARSHVHNLKTKTGCRSMVDLVKQVAVLPPMVTTLNRAQPDQTSS